MPESWILTVNWKSPVLPKNTTVYKIRLSSDTYSRLGNLISDTFNIMQRQTIKNSTLFRNPFQSGDLYSSTTESNTAEYPVTQRPSSPFDKNL